MADFDNIKETGFFKALFATWKKSLFSPEVFYKEFYKEIENAGNKGGQGILRPYFYAITFTYINLVFSFFWEVIFFKIGFYKNYAILPKIPLFFTNKSFVDLYIIIGVIFLLFLLGILYTIFLTLLTIVIHGFVMLMGGKKGIKNTFRIIGYASGVGVFSIFPIFGYNISAGWFAALLIIGVRETNGLSTQKSIMTVLLPFIFVSLILVTFFIKIIIAR
ncbi:MAG: YIP1 family protein [bacterium]